jgi:endonuclease YncB( thermonuclease family)
MFLIPRSLACLAAGFAAGLVAGSPIAPVNASRGVNDLPVPMSQKAAPAGRGYHPADVLRVIDGDTFEARVQVWPGIAITSRVRLRGIDAPEMRARCADEQAKAVAARDALVRILSEGSVGIARITQDKYGGRVDAEVSTAATDDVAAVMLASGLARAYSGRRRASWCG